MDCCEVDHLQCFYYVDNSLEFELIELVAVVRFLTVETISDMIALV